MLRRRRAKDDDVGFRLLQAFAVVGEAPFTRDAQLANSFLHPIGPFVTDAHKLDMRMLQGHPQQVAHVEVVEVDSGKSPAFLFHGVWLVDYHQAIPDARNNTREASGLNRARTAGSMNLVVGRDSVEP